MKNFSIFVLSVFVCAAVFASYVEASTSGPCKYCDYCSFCGECEKCPCNPDKNSNCNYCKYCSYCRLCDACSLCSEGGVVDAISSYVSSISETLGLSAESVDTATIDKDIAKLKVHPPKYKPRTKPSLSPSAAPSAEATKDEL